MTFNNTSSLKKRFQILRNIREYFWSKDYTEIDTPVIVDSPGMELHVDALSVKGENIKDKHLITSPEFALKKYLGAGYENIFQITKTFRDEPSHQYHSSEFTMLEWYATGMELDEFIIFLRDFIIELAEKTNNSTIVPFDGKKIDLADEWQVLSIPVLFQEMLQIQLTPDYSFELLAKDCKELGLTVDKSDDWDDLFFKIFLTEIEPVVTKEKVTVFTNYPPTQAALASINEQGWSGRFELYVDDLELANAFYELTDSVEQKRRFEEVMEKRRQIGKETYQIDNELIEAVGKMPPTSGIALGVDRLVMLLTGESSIAKILP